MQHPSNLLFDLIEQEVKRATRRITNGVLAEFRADSPSTENRENLKILVNTEMTNFVQGFFGIFTNVGSVLPEHSQGFRIVDAISNVDISIDSADYSDMWLEYLFNKEEDLDE